jgi:hypothetical protein
LERLFEVRSIKSKFELRSYSFCNALKYSFTVMNNVILQPCSSKGAIEHYTNTIEQLVPLSTVLSFIESQHAEALEQIYSSGECAVWGLTPGKKDVNSGKWARIKEGDVTVFSSKGRVFASAVVSYKVRNAALARHLWGSDESGQTWEYVYFLDEVRTTDITYTTFNQVVGYDPKFVIQGFSILDAAKSQKFFEAFGLRSETYVEPIAQVVYEDLQDKLNSLSETDAEVSGKRRLEQGYLKQHLFGRRTIATCGICEQEYPIAFLVAAHIKRRAACSSTERKDLNVVMPMCKLGCDELFEHGYIAVQAGQVVDLAKKPTTPRIQLRVSEVANRACGYATPARATYFQWHLEDHRK